MAALVMVLLVLGANLFVVPKFRKIFEDFDVALPMGTQLVVGMSNVVVSLGFWVAPLVLLGFAALVAWIWFLDWRSALAAAGLLIVLMLAYGVAGYVSMWLPLVSLMGTARGGSP